MKMNVKEVLNQIGSEKGSIRESFLQEVVIELRS